MAIRGNITLTDAATTPVNHVYSPVMQKGDVLFWKDRTATTVPIGQNSLTLMQRVPSKQAKTYKFVWKLDCPILEQTSASTTTGIQPAPTLAYNNFAVIDIVLSERATLQERKDLLSQLRDLIDEAIVTSQSHDLEVIF
ncbi:coat protein [ssRNA phage SRR5466727_3]|uniref:Coat protein n=1 Tax=ssRNA phage SRR5466727_3 TaxID=2786432 RepID=A0A8S5L430_9VIRU|nr:coat protein [ssRNA phage SRR5466727_3]DAD52448.1 TPA_asm: coat protein [ssRNA phage SRR5466727_3]